MKQYLSPVEWSISIRLLNKSFYMVKMSGSEVCSPKTLPPTSGKRSWPRSGPTEPSASTLIGYLRRWPSNRTNSSPMYLVQLLLAFEFTYSTHSRL